MIEEFVKTVLQKQINTVYQHLEFPPLMYARITKAIKTSDTYNIEVTGKLKDEGTEAEYIYSGNWYEYSIKIIDTEENTKNDFPEIPRIKSKLQLQVGAKVLIGLVYGQLLPFIIGEVC